MRVSEALRDEDHPLVELKDIWFRYEREGRDIVKDLALRVCPGELLCVCGGNGTGKSTMLGVITGENKYYRGRARTLGLDPKKADGRALTGAGLAALPQDPQTLFTRATVFDNLIEVAYACAKRRGEKPVPENIEADVRRVCALTDTEGLIGFHPYDVSGGEQQRTGLAMALLTRPKLLLLDEPTKGMDSFFKEKFAAILENLCADGIGVLMVSHDVEFCAKYADRCALFFNGGIVSEGAPRAFFSGNSFYTTSANRMSRGILKDAITAEEIIDGFRLRKR
jgi:energy-coupling factor transport system ATP-binding protein